MSVVRGTDHTLFKEIRLAIKKNYALQQCAGIVLFVCDAALARETRQTMGFLRAKPLGGVKGQSPLRPSYNNVIPASRHLRWVSASQMED